MKNLVMMGVLAMAGVAHASDPVGVYGLVNGVVLQPNATAPTHVQLFGWFALADKATSDYTKPQAGYMYYACPSGDAATCAMEWADIQKIGAAGDCLGYGSRRDPVTFQYRDNGVVRATGEAPAKPNVYPIAMGVATIDDHNHVCQSLKAAAGEAWDAGTVTPPASDLAKPAGNTDPSTPAPQPTLQTARGCSASGGAAAGTGALIALAMAIVGFGLRRRALIVLGLAAISSPAWASDQVGVYGLVQAVQFEPNANDVSTATRVRISGWLTIANGAVGMGDRYSTPENGYVYYTCPSGMEATCRMEWTDIRSGIGTGNDCKGWGSRAFYPTPGNGTVRTTSALINPDTYPIQMGVVTPPAGNISQCPQLRAAAGNPPAGDMAGAGDLAGSPSDLAATPAPSTKGCSAAGGAGAGAGALLAFAVFAMVQLLRRRRAVNRQGR
jgi:uncharacterized protein (TIGR03382 family)